MGELIAFRPSSPARAAEPAPAEPLWREAVGRELRGQRTADGRTLADVAGEAGVSTQYLSEVERGRKEPSSEVLSAVAGALGLRLVDLTARVTRQIAARPAGPVCLAA
ncbi:helix-turn-helix domain-containing protein [Nocardioides lijunqiniae]|uniref:helix-turn-helix domain-containing protein n=1 Tax=Nocardioides lijunqiniae TaxID=2760832 RepID=UPI001878E5FA|nr:helix-turn-helix transcriptional regulator [Nocardioides lijunqiniae]